MRGVAGGETMTAPGAVGTLWTTAFINPPCSAHRLPNSVGALYHVREDCYMGRSGMGEYRKLPGGEREHVGAF